MARYLQRAETWLRRLRDTHLKACDTNTTTYARGLTEIGLDMTQAETRYETDDGETIVNSSMADWLIDRAAMITFGEPQPGDKITITLAHGTETYEVAAIGGEPAWRWHGRDGQTFRIHTVRI